MQKFETFATPRLTIQPQKLERLIYPEVTRPHLIDDVVDALQHSTRKRWIQGAPRLQGNIFKSPRFLASWSPGHE